jgi:hypothetical protein
VDVSSSEQEAAGSELVPAGQMDEREPASLLRSLADLAVRAVGGVLLLIPTGGPRRPPRL